MPSTVTPKQQRYLFSKGSPLSAKQKEKMANEMRKGVVKVKPKGKTKSKDDLDDPQTLGDVLDFLDISSDR